MYTFKLHHNIKNVFDYKKNAGIAYDIKYI